MKRKTLITFVSFPLFFFFFLGEEENIAFKLLTSFPFYKVRLNLKAI